MWHVMFNFPPMTTRSGRQVRQPLSRGEPLTISEARQIRDREATAEASSDESSMSGEDGATTPARPARSMLDILASFPVNDEGTQEDEAVGDLVEGTCVVFYPITMTCV